MSNVSTTSKKTNLWTLHVLEADLELLQVEDRNL